MKILYLFFAGLALFSCGQPASTSKPIENITATNDQKERRINSENICRSHNIPIYKDPHSLFTDPENEVNIRTKDEVADRALALCFIELRSENADKKMLASFDKRYNVMQKLSENEKAFILSEAPTQQEMVNANWRAEGTHVMLWALGYVDSLSFPGKACDVAKDVKHIYDNTEEQFRQKAKLRSKKEILDQVDLILRLHWACVDARVNNRPTPGVLDNSVVMERHYALNWLIRYMDQMWDDVTIDT